jgi:outer membrane protein assembly factor BamB
MKASAILLLLLVLPVLPAPVLADSTDSASSAAAADWPQWRGVNRDAVSPETGLLGRWPESGPKVLWRTEVGAGFSSVSVSAGKLYTMWDEEKTQFLLCLDARTARELWRLKIGAAFNNYYGNGPRSTPLIDGKTVFAVGTGGRLVAANKDTGELLWKHDLATEFEAALPSYGYSSSPMVSGDKLVIEAGGKQAAFMAFDKKTGKPVWSSENDQPAYSSPIEISVGGVRQIVFWSAHGLHSVSAKDGKVLWRFAWETFCPVSGDPLNTGTPIFVAPDRIYIASGSGAALLRLVLGDKKFKVETLWENDEMRSDVNTSLLLAGHIYGFDRGTLKCLDVKTGEIKWAARGFQRGSLIAADGKLIVLGEQGKLALVEADPDRFVEHASAQVLEGRNWTSPSLAGGKLYLRNHEEMVCLDMK